MTLQELMNDFLFQKCAMGVRAGFRDVYERGGLR